MNSSSLDISSFKRRKDLKTSEVSELSPVTNLTINLSGLSTSFAGTPVRHTLGSNPISVGFSSDDSPYKESPKFHDVFQRKSKSKHRVRKCISKVLPSDSEDEKENLMPSDIDTAYKSEDNVPCSSQDSGYSCISDSYSLDSPSPSLKIKSKGFFTEDEHGFENIFELEEIEDANTLSPLPKSMSNLLSHPLSNSHKSPCRPSNSRYSKLPIRRCLSMDMDSESDASSSENTSKVGTPLKSPPNFSQNSDLSSKTKTVFKRPEPPCEYALLNKRRKSCASIEDNPCQVEGEDGKAFVFKRSYSETAATIMHALLKADLQPELIGDGSRSYALPLIKGRHQDLKSISPETLSALLKGDFKHQIDSYTLIDCRYPYEFDGGHIQGAENIYTKEDIMTTFLEKSFSCSDPKTALIFHCEFSSERAPTLCRFLRNKDRELNQGNYPHLYYPEIYILEGGYKAFFENHKEFCEPQQYKPMNHKDHGFELRHFRAKSKSWGSDSKNRYKLRSTAKHTLI